MYCNIVEGGEGGGLGMILENIKILKIYHVKGWYNIKISECEKMQATLLFNTVSQDSEKNRF